MSPRTFKRNSAWWQDPNNVKQDKNGNFKDERLPAVENNWKQAKKTVFLWLADRFHRYFKQNDNDFDKWHTCICNSFLEKFTPELDKYGYDGKASLKYGKAQKIVNMTFKNLFCFDDAMTYIKKFDNCHMPIDSYILNWYNDMFPIKKCNTAWSDLDRGTYCELQKNIKNALGTTYKPFWAEFYIWSEYNV